MQEQIKKLTQKVGKDEYKLQVESAIRDSEGNKISTTYAKKTELPENVSELTNDIGYITLDDIPEIDYDTLKNIPIINKDLRDYKNALPTGYRELSAITTTGNQQIDTGVVCTNNTNFEFTFDITAITANNSKINLISDNENILVSLDTNSHLLVTYNGEAEQDLGAISGKTIIKKTNNIFYINGTNVYTGSTNEFVSSSSLKLLSSTSCTSGIQVINCRVYEGETAARLLLPTIRTSDSVIGLYDMKTKTLFTNSGEGSFAAGESIIGTSITGYKEVEYIGSYNNTTIGWFNTNYKPNGNTRIKAKFKRTNAIDSTNFPTVFGAQYGSGGTTKRFAYMASATSSSVTTARADYNATMKYDKAVQATPNKETIIDFNKNEVSINGGTVVKVESAAADFTVGNALGIFNLNNYLQTRSQFVGYIYYVQIFENDTLVKEYIPMVRTSDNVVGFYELLEGKFIEKTGSASFMAGSAVESQLSTDTIPGIITQQVYRHTGNSNADFIKGHLYIFEDKIWKDLIATSVDLSNFYTKADVDDALTKHNTDLTAHGFKYTDVVFE